jgi:hypothetical protein
MSLESFREILLKKTVGNKALSAFVHNIGEEILFEHVVEALEKMARPTHNTGSKVSGPVATYAANLDRSDVMQLRDAMSHHASHYKAALKAHHSAADPSEKKRMREVADQHMGHLIPLMHLAAKAGSNSGGRLGLDYTYLPAWETNYTTLDRRPETGKFKRDTKKLGARPMKGARRWSAENPENRGIPDYHYLEMAPHHGHEHWDSMPHEGGYPWEEVQIGSQADIDNKRAYIHIDDIADKKEYEPHPFDFHPIREVQDIQEEHFSPERLDKFANDLASWKGGEHHKRWIDSQRAAHQSDPEGYKKRGTTKASHFYEGIPLQEQPGHVSKHPKRPKRVGGAATADALAAIKAKIASPGQAPSVPTSPATPGAPRAVAPMVRKPQTPAPAAPPAASTPAPAQPAAPAPAPPAAPHPMEEVYNHYTKAPDAIKKIFHGNKEFMNYLATRKDK